jgi:predicted outer membrane repeat protein
MAQNGGAIKNSYSNLIMSNSKITNNSANGAGGGINLEGDRSHTLINCLISNNSAQGQGGGILASSAEATILNSTFSNNSAALDYGGGIYGDRDLNIVNSIFWGDTANGNPDEIYLTQSGYAHFTYSDIQGGWSGTGNIDVDPLFAGGGDYHLADGSPCIDAGTDDSVTYPSLPVNDMDGNSRPEGLGYDMGAYEYFCTDPDTDGDGVADCFDPCPLDNPDDSDDDGICASDDNCPGIANPNQIDGDSDGTGDACDSCPNDAANDLDADDVCGDVDNCPAVANPAQDDTDGDFIGDACDLDIDGDGLTNLEEYELGTDPMLKDTDGDGVEDGFDGYPLDDTASECPVLVRCYETSEPYASLQDAFDDSLIVAGDTIQCTASNLTDALRFEQDKEIFLQGGFFCGYTDNPSYSTINGSLTINNGTVRVERIIIQ